MTSTTADLGHLLTRTALRHSSADAVIDGNRRLTFSELDERSTRLANGLVALVEPGSFPVALLLDNSLEFVEADLALVKAGLAKVPINPRLSHDERLFIVKDSGAAALIAEAHHLESAMAIASEAETVRAVIAVGAASRSVRDYEDVIAGGLGSSERRPWKPDDPSVILYTSGTTGRPKGATASFRSRFAATLNMLLDELDPKPGDGMIHAGPLSHGSGSKILAYFLSGARNILMPRFEPDEFMKLAAEHRATASFVVPTMISMLIEAAGTDGAGTLRSITYGGAPIAPTLLQRAVDTFGPVFVQVYGSAEAPHPLTVLTKEDHLAGLERAELLSSAGRPVTAIELRIASPDGEPLSAGQIGEIQVRGESVMTGYWNRIDASREAFVTDFYRTGDLGFVDDRGYLSIVDRERDMVISGGLNVYPAEVEAVLYRHPGVLEAAVIGTPDERWGEIVTAFVVVRSGYALDSEEITEHCERLLAGYKKPRRIEFVSQLPRGSTGKILKTELRHPYWTGHSRQVV